MPGVTDRLQHSSRPAGVTAVGDDLVFDLALDLRNYSRSARPVLVRGKGNKDRVIGLPEP